MNITYTITGLIDSNVAQQMIVWVGQQMLTQKIDTLKIFISSAGGDVDSAIRIYSYLKGLPFNVETVGISQIDSMANIIFLAGEKRIALDGCRFFLHNIVFNLNTTNGYLSYFEEIVRGFREMEKRHVAILVNELKKTENEIMELLRQANFYSSQQAKEMHLATEIVSKI